MSKAAANLITVLGLDDIISIATVATVVWDERGGRSDEELMARSLATVGILLDSGWAEIGDMVVSEWALENQKLALTDPDEATQRLFARSRELVSEESGAGDGPIRKWPLTTDQALARIRKEWIALGTRTPGAADIGWLQTTARGDERGRMMLDLQNRVIDFALKNRRGSIVQLSELTAFLKGLAPDFSAEELREGVIFALDGLLTGKRVEVGNLQKTLGRVRFVRWKGTDVDEALHWVRRTCAGFPGEPTRGHDCAVRII